MKDKNKETDKLVEEAEMDIMNKSKYIFGQIDSIFNNTISDLRNRGYDTAELKRKYSKAKQNFMQQREESMLRLNQERKEGTNLVHKVVLTASALTTGIGIYTTSLGYYSDDQNLILGGAITLGAGLRGLVYSFLRK